jgi:hypothetical protein
MNRWLAFALIWLSFNAGFVFGVGWNNFWTFMKLFEWKERWSRVLHRGPVPAHASRARHDDH